MKKRDGGTVYDTSNIRDFSYAAKPEEICRFEESSGTMLAPVGGKQFDLMKIYNSQGRDPEGFQHLLEQDLYGYLRGFGAVA